MAEDDAQTPETGAPQESTDGDSADATEDTAAIYPVGAEESTAEEPAEEEFAPERAAAEPAAPDAPGGLKGLTIRLLRGAIAVLENLIEKLEQPAAGEAGGLPGWLPTGVLALGAIVLIWLGVTLFSGETEPEEVATAPPVAEVEPDSESQPSTPQPVEEPIATSPEPEPAPMPPPAPKPQAPPKPKSAPKSDVPELKLTPEQSLIAAIQRQVDDITSEYAPGSIQSIAANLRDSRLTVTVSDAWYDLDSEQQDRLADEMLARARSLDFAKLAIADENQDLIARSPVVGEGMVVFRR